jgi:hypothetical protein
MGDLTKNPSQITKKQHWLPEFYLKKFSNKGDLRAFDLKNGYVLKKPYTPAEICYGEFFYGKKTGEPDDISQLFEHLFEVMESKFGLFYDEFCRDVVCSNPSEERLYEVAQNLGVLWLRSPVMRDMLQNLQEDFYKQITSMHASFKECYYRDIDKATAAKLSDEEKEEIRITILEKKYRLEFDNTVHLKMIMQMAGYGNLFFHKKWRVYYIANNDPWKFITSDTAVIEVFPNRAGVYGPSFMDRTHYFALTPKILIEFIASWSPGKRLKRKQLKTQEEVNKFNFLRLNWSHKYSYSSSEDDFKFALIDLEKKEKALSIFRDIAHLKTMP